MRHRWLLRLFAPSGSAAGAVEPAPVVKIGSKKFTESVILAQMACYLVREPAVRPSTAANWAPRPSSGPPF